MQRGDLGVKHIAATQGLGDGRETRGLGAQINRQAVAFAQIVIESGQRPCSEFFQARATVTRLDKRHRADEYTLLVA
jgi:hypothetical protein